MIEKKIHYIWMGGEKPEKVRRCIDSWKKVMPDYEIVEWNEKNINISKKRKESPFFKLCYDKKIWGVITDYIRTEILYFHGGIYLDADVEVLKPFDDFLENDLFMGYQEGDAICYAVVGAIPKQKFISAMYDFYRYEVMSSPLYISTEIIGEILPRVYKTKEEYKENKVSIYPPRYFYPYCWNEKFTPECVKEDTYAIHRWDGSWTKNPKAYYLEIKAYKPFVREVLYYIHKIKSKTKR